jgi:hypothetical protein
MSLLLYLIDGGLLAAAVRWWRPRASRRAMAAYLLLAGGFYAVPLATRNLQVGTDLPYLVLPWSEMAEPGLVPGNDLLSDVPLLLLPFRAVVREQLLRLQAPVWTHQLATGQPVLGNGWSAPFSPLHLLTLPLPPARAMTVAAALQMLLALLLMDALLAALGAGAAGAAFGAIAYALSVFSVAWAYHPQAMAAAWLPGVLLGLLLLRRGERGGAAGVIACGAGLAYSGHPETLAHACLAAGAVAAALLLTGTGQLSRRRFAAKAAAAAAVAACLAAPVLLPVLETVPESVRLATVRRYPELLAPPPFAAKLLQVLIDPLALGSPRDHNWEVGKAGKDAGKAGTAETAGIYNFNELCSGYAGLLALALAAAAAVALGGRVLALMLGGAAALLAALRLPPFYDLVTALPALGHAPNGRLRLLWALAVAVAAGSSLEALPSRRRGRLAAGAAIVVAGAALAALPPPLSPPAGWQLAWWIAALAGAALALAALAAPRLRSAFPWIAVAALAVDLLLLGVRYHPVMPARFDLAPPPALARLIDLLRAEPGPQRALAEGEDLMPNLGALYGLWDPRGNDPMQPARAAMVAGTGLRGRFTWGQEIVLSRRIDARPMLDFLAVRYLLTAHRRVLQPPWQLVWEGRGGKLWRNPGALPLFFLPAAYRLAVDPAEALRVTLANRDLAAMAVAEPAAATSAATRLAAGADGVQGTVRVRRVTSDGFDLEVTSATGGLVVSSVSYAPGWRLAIDGKRVERGLPQVSGERVDGGPLRVDAGFLGFAVAPGTHRVELVYRPVTWDLSLRLAGAGLVAAIGWWLLLLSGARACRPG